MAHAARSHGSVAAIGMCIYALCNTHGGGAVLAEASGDFAHTSSNMIQPSSYSSMERIGQRSEEKRGVASGCGPVTRPILLA